MIETIAHGLNVYPKFQASGHASRFAAPFARELCRGRGVDVGCGPPEWCLPGAAPADNRIPGCPFHAQYLGSEKWDYIFSSHLLEHMVDWVGVLDYWTGMLKAGGVLFLYLPHPDQTYWRPWNNRKHLHILQPEIVEKYLYDKGYKNIFVTGRDLNHSYYAVGNRPA